MRETKQNDISGTIDVLGMGSGTKNFCLCQTGTAWPDPTRSTQAMTLLDDLFLKNIERYELEFLTQLGYWL